MIEIAKKIFLFAYNKDILDCESLLKDINILTKQDKVSLNEYNIAIFLESYILLGSKETLDNPLYFGELDSKGIDSKNELDETKPIYYLETDSDEFDIESNSTDSNTYQNNTNSSHTNTNRVGTSTLQVFLNDSTLTLLNYSLLDSSLNIKLEYKSQESKAIQEREKELRKAQRDCHDFLHKSRNDDINRDKDSKTQDSQSTAMLHPVLEDNEIKCPHGETIKLKLNNKKQKLRLYNKEYLY